VKMNLVAAIYEDGGDKVLKISEPDEDGSVYVTISKMESEEVESEECDIRFSETDLVTIVVDAGDLKRAVDFLFGHAPQLNVEERSDEG